MTRALVLARLAAILAVTATMLALPCAAESPKLPAELNFLSTWGEVHTRYPYEAWGEATFPRYGDNQVNRQGRHWTLWVEIPAPKGSTALKDGWAVARPVAIKAGWTVVSENPNGGFLALLHYNRNGVEAWMNAVMDTQTRLVLDCIEIGPPPISLTLKEPAATPEKLPEGGKGDFPFLSPIPGSTAHGGDESAAPLRLTPKGASQPEIVANGSVERRYSLKDLSKVLFSVVYHDALTKAGWEIVQESANHEVIVAHYAKNGRNIWAYLNDHDESYSIQVGREASTDQMKASLAASCHVALYGVLFDFNKSTLQAASDAPLQQVAALMAANPSLSIEVQGHTDNVGGDAYNQTLSEGRAQSVMAWLAQHGVASTRMGAKGYGKTMPVADNNTDEGRMKNRRVEIADPRCKPRGK
ncbi:MAG TPA: OmpA family protein [Usitatibacter sp.]|nr:OmpA family protein [Usitatibacter sp.]